MLSDLVIFIEDHPQEIVLGGAFSIVLFLGIINQFLSRWFRRNFLLLKIAVDDSIVSVRFWFFWITVVVKYPDPRVDEHNFEERAINGFSPARYEVHKVKRKSRKLTFSFRRLWSAKSFYLKWWHFRKDKLFWGKNKFGDSIYTPVFHAGIFGFTGKGKSVCIAQLTEQLVWMGYEVIYSSVKASDLNTELFSKTFHLGTQSDIDSLIKLMTKSLKMAEFESKTEQKKIFIIDEVGYAISRQETLNKANMVLFNRIAELLRLGRESKAFVFLASQRLEIAELSKKTPISRHDVKILVSYWVKEEKAFENAFGAGKLNELQKPGEGYLHSDDIIVRFVGPKGSKDESLE